MWMSAREVRDYFDPWPIRLPNGYYHVGLRSMSECMKLKSCWKDKHGRNVTIRTLHKWIQEKDWCGKRHQVNSRARSKIERPFVLIIGQRIWDGNHTLLALCKQGYRGKVMVVKLVERSKRRGYV